MVNKSIERTFPVREENVLCTADIVPLWQRDRLRAPEKKLKNPVKN